MGSLRTSLSSVISRHRYVAIMILLGALHFGANVVNFEYYSAVKRIRMLEKRIKQLENIVLVQRPGFGGSVRGQGHENGSIAVNFSFTGSAWARSNSVQSAEVPSLNLSSVVGGRHTRMSGCSNLTNLPLDGPMCIRFFTYASHAGRDDKFCKSLKSAVRMSIDLHVLGWGVKWRGLQQKFQAVLEILREIPPECVVVFADGHDVLYMQSAAKILATYRQVATQAKASIIFSAECGCWPQVMRDKGKTCRDKYPPSPTPLRYLNSGSWMAPAGAALRYFDYLMADIPADAKGINDQELASDSYMNDTLRERFAVGLDHHGRLFGVMHSIDDNTLVPKCNPHPWYKFQEGTGFVNTHLNSTPGLMHFNGGGKALFDDYNRRLQEKTKEPPQGGTLKFRDHCRTLSEAVGCAAGR